MVRLFTTMHMEIYLKKGRMMVTDAGAETNLHYASDITRTTPVGGKFSQQQKDIYEIVLKANTEAIKATRPGISNRDLHFMACKIIASEMKDLGLMKGILMRQLLQELMHFSCLTVLAI